MYADWGGGFFGTEQLRDKKDTPHNTMPMPNTEQAQAQSQQFQDAIALGKQSLQRQSAVRKALLARAKAAREFYIQLGSALAAFSPTLQSAGASLGEAEYAHALAQAAILDTETQVLTSNIAGVEAQYTQWKAQVQAREQAGLIVVPDLAGPLGRA